MYVYQAELLRVIDGDTLVVRIDLGLDVHVVEKCRLNGINCPELSTPAGLAAKDFTANWFAVTPYDHLVVRTTKDRKEKYGRYLIDVYAGTACLNEDLVVNQHAKRYSGGKR